MDNELEKIRSYLSARHFHASREWIEGCVSYFREQHEGERYNYSEMQEFVTQQWELADLREISPGCLPPNLALQKKTVLTGKYSLQVESMCDIAKSFYSQLQAIRNVPLENVKATEKQKESWEPSAKRVLQLMLCDGVQEIKAIEYKPVRALDQQIVPGFKILIIGPVDCRRGIIMLEERNLQLIGGEVDSLLVPNALENILARALNLEENPDPYNCQTDTPAQNSIRTTNDQPANIRQRNEAAFLVEDDDDDIFAQEVDAQLKQLEEQQQKVEQHSQNARNVNDRVEQEVDAFEEAYQREMEMMDMDDDDIETIEQQPLFAVASKPTVSYNQNSTSKRSNQGNNSIALETELLEDDDIFLNVSDADLEPTPELNKSIEIVEDVKTTTNVGGGAGPSREPEVISLLDDSNVDDSFFMQPGLSGITPRTLPLSSKLQKEIGGRSQKPPAKAKPVNLKSANQAKISSFFNRDSSSTNRQHSESSKVDFHYAVEKHSKEVPRTAQTPLLQDPVHLGNISDFVDDLFSEPTFPDHSHTSTSAVSNIEEECLVIDSKPFVYIQQIKDAKLTTPAIYTVKGFVLSLTSFLKTKFDGWYLTAKLCDGSATLDVQFSSDVLDNFIGYSLNEVKAMKKDVDKNPLIKERLNKALQKAQQQLIELNALFTLSFDPESDLPCVTMVTDLKEEHLKALKARVRIAQSLKHS
ncbi:recQ-mediated genome instability protein 1-like [Schistocerca americana]|uniref:recQ-mediated genome instability protein 1-like n=1 Tax=Schistocerca americana TaxID=7009 RepID=UPI001F4FF14E|nr:recQ-mediated genome instability protein 1-like [Schistocerca americana]XP_049951019.1 recQ-mediated genome instability protein 1-like [Schistocerca serialis cubense]